MTEKSKQNESKLQVPSAISPFHMEVERLSSGMQILVSGIIGVKDFSTESLELLSHSGRVFIYGSRLSMMVYENGTVEIRGRVDSVRFGYGKG